jgi:hypothetical protein
VRKILFARLNRAQRFTRQNKRAGLAADRWVTWWRSAGDLVGSEAVGWWCPGCWPAVAPNTRPSCWPAGTMPNPAGLELVSGTTTSTATGHTGTSHTTRKPCAAALPERVRGGAQRPARHAPRPPRCTRAHTVPRLAPPIAPSDLIGCPGAAPTRRPPQQVPPPTRAHEGNSAPVKRAFREFAPGWSLGKNVCNTKRGGAQRPARRPPQ